MNFVETIREERNERTVPLSRFYSEYKKSSNICYGFVEGKDDPSYYRHVINSKLPCNCSIVLYPSNGKKNVHYIYNEIQKRNYQHSQITYYLDRDLSMYLEDPNIIHDEQVYITDNYSIENDFLSDETLEYVVRDIFGFSNINQTEANKIRDFFNEQRNLFEKMMLPIMANIIFWKRNNYLPANYNNFHIKDVISIDDSGVSFKVSEEFAIQTLYKQSNVAYEKYNIEQVELIINEIKEHSKQIVRGKYLAEFFIIFCNNMKTYKLGINLKNKHRHLCNNDIMEVIAPRSRAPQSLIYFIDNRVLPYFHTK